jgi:hypothetical protein
MKERVLRATLIGLSAAAWLAFIGLAAVRITHPFPLDAGEGAWLDESTRLAQGQPLYVAPTLAYVPLPVMPGFALVASALVSVFGAHFWILRLLASTATLLIAWLVGFAVRRETKSPLLGMVAAGLWLGAFAATGARFDLGRPDTWSWAWSIAALVTLRFTRGDVGAAAAALLMTVALSCSLLNSVFALAALIHLAVNDRPRLAAHGLTLAVLAAGAWMGLSRVLGPWFTFYTWRLPLHQLVHGAPRIGQWARLGLVDFLGPVAVSCLLASALPTPQWRGPTGVWIWAALGGVAATLVGALGLPGMSAGLGPAAATLAIAGPVALARVVKHVATWPGSERAGRMWALQAVLLLACTITLAPLGPTGARAPSIPCCSSGSGRCAVRCWRRDMERCRRAPATVRRSIRWRSICSRRRASTACRCPTPLRSIACSSRCAQAPSGRRWCSRGVSRISGRRRGRARPGATGSRPSGRSSPARRRRTSSTCPTRRLPRRPRRRWRISSSPAPAPRSTP